MKKVFNRKRSKPIQNPFQKNEDSIFFHPKIVIPILILSSLIFTCILFVSPSVTGSTLDVNNGIGKSGSDIHIKTAGTGKGTGIVTHDEYDDDDEEEEDDYIVDTDMISKKKDLQKIPEQKSKSTNLLDTTKSFFKKRRRNNDNDNINNKQEKKIIQKVPQEIEIPPSSFQNHNDPNLKTMTFKLPSYGNSTTDKGKGQLQGQERTFQAYVQPHISTFYNPSGNAQNNNMTMTQVKPKFHGEAGKFINLSNQPLSLYWTNGRPGSTQFIAHVNPFQAVGTATFPGHIFLLTKNNDPENVKHTFNVIANKNIYAYDPYYDIDNEKVEIDVIHEVLNLEEQKMYWLQRNSLEFGKEYYKFTGREWLSLYPVRKQPSYHMWNADYFGQEHWFTSKETHYVTEPPENLLGMLELDEFHKEVLDRKRHLSDYRHKEGADMGAVTVGTDADGDEYLNMTIKVLSCAPRVFEIKNFLSHVEVDHIVHMATGMKLRLSTTSGSENGSDRTSDSKTRTSKNSWVKRRKSPIIDSIYRRAADLMQIDEALLRRRDENERPNVNHQGSNSEDLQLVHYDVSEQYTAHHDFTYPNAHNDAQPVRFATLLLYLNEGMRGGETSFPRWVNAEHGRKLKVTPEVGKAVLFYSALPDGNMDDLSQHAAEPVRDGEKWLINLWTWDPMFRN
jgi:prolyl 4-hydroxylase